MHDQSVDPDLALFQHLFESFKNPNFEVQQPALMDTEGHDKTKRINPKDEKWQTRDATWLMETWDKYLKPDYKKVLLKWYKETGGGPKTDDQFHKYCNNKTWLTWIYLLDKKSDLLLASGSHFTFRIDCNCKNFVILCFV